jgi:hypothetical protein
MAATSGLTRRRGGGGAGGAAASSETSAFNNSESHAGSIGDIGSSGTTDLGTASNGHRVAYDPRDLGDSADRAKQPKLTMMEEVLLLGLKDQQVRLFSSLRGELLTDSSRAISRFGTTTYPTLSADASSWNLPCAAALPWRKAPRGATTVYMIA